MCSFVFLIRHWPEEAGHNKYVARNSILSDVGDIHTMGTGTAAGSAMPTPSSPSRAYDLNKHSLHRQSSSKSLHGGYHGEQGENRFEKSKLKHSADGGFSKKRTSGGRGEDIRGAHEKFKHIHPVAGTSYTQVIVSPHKSGGLSKKQMKMKLLAEKINSSYFARTAESSIVKEEEEFSLADEVVSQKEFKSPPPFTGRKNKGLVGKKKTKAFVTPSDSGVSIENVNNSLDGREDKNVFDATGPKITMRQAKTPMSAEVEAHVCDSIDSVVAQSSSSSEQLIPEYSEEPVEIISPEPDPVTSRSTVLDIVAMVSSPLDYCEDDDNISVTVSSPGCGAEVTAYVDSLVQDDTFFDVPSEGVGSILDVVSLPEMSVSIDDPSAFEMIANEEEVHEEQEVEEEEEEDFVRPPRTPPLSDDTGRSRHRKHAQTDMLQTPPDRRQDLILSSSDDDDVLAVQHHRARNLSPSPVSSIAMRSPSSVYPKVSLQLFPKDEPTSYAAYGESPPPGEYASDADDGSNSSLHSRQHVAEDIVEHQSRDKVETIRIGFGSRSGHAFTIKVSLLR